MAEAPKPNPRLETEVVMGDTATTATMGSDPKASTRTNAGVSVELDMGGGLPEEDDLPQEDEGDEPQDPPADEGDKPEGEEGDKPEEGDEDPDLTDLGEWKDTPEVMEKFDARYFKDGKLDQAVLSKEFWANYSKAEDKSATTLNPNTLSYLNDRLGLQPEFVKEVCDSLVAKQSANEDALFSRVGGKESFDKMVQWGRDGGYTPAQRERFNKALKAGGADLEDALDALQARYMKANPDAARQANTPPRPPRRSTPERNATAAAGGNGAASAGDTFKTKAEYAKAWSAGLAAQKTAATPQEKREARANLDKLRAKARRSRFQ